MCVRKRERRRGRKREKRDSKVDRKVGKGQTDKGGEEYVYTQTYPVRRRGDVEQGRKTPVKTELSKIGRNQSSSGGKRQKVYQSLVNDRRSTPSMYVVILVGSHPSTQPTVSLLVCLSVIDSRNRMISGPCRTHESIRTSVEKIVP